MRWQGLGTSAAFIVVGVYAVLGMTGQMSREPGTEFLYPAIVWTLGFFIQQMPVGWIKTAGLLMAVLSAFYSLAQIVAHFF
ncbi:hypothetical protein CR205_10315 [Alteribacter lacisalsi]|uniref:Uncharacterized protein n=1 Tax=Alteribacter lacisalsi TaxID=2045244 RepID=A0A2W0HYS1_9BACI|nr:hypothetical protein [Alteribacter lacisalsi]PYZ98938.1 hypothetical protein CR205_10315 [Alteribacter lacisalsi]